MLRPFFDHENILEVGMSCWFRAWLHPGYSCILFLFWAFAPFIVAFSAVARLENLQTIVPSLHVVVMLWPVTRTVWNGLASSLALGLFDSWQH